MWAATSGAYSAYRFSVSQARMFSAALRVNFPDSTAD
jgi:hypothetical protein